MRLQQLMTNKIDEFGGIDKLTQNLESFRTLTKEKVWFDNMIIFFNNLYTTPDMNVEEYALEYTQASLDTIEFLKKFNSTNPSETNSFLIDLIDFKLKHISNMRKIS